MNTMIGNREIYDSNWPAWMEMKVHGPASRWLRSLVRAQLSATPDSQSIRSVLDVGCGEGTMTDCLARWLPHAQITGIDFSKTGIQCAESRYRRSNLTFIHDETSHELAREFDLVTAFEVLEHVENWQDLLRRISNCARQFVLLSFPTGRMRGFERDVGHYRNFAKGEVEAFMFECGFQPRACWYAGFPFYSPLYRDACDLTYSFSSSFSAGPYGKSKKFVSQILYLLFRFLSTRRKFGEQFCGLFVNRSRGGKILGA